MMLIDTKRRPSGIDQLGEMSWGTHFCLFYESAEDLLDIMIPYFKAGLENQEYCLCITSEPVLAEEAERSLRQAIPDWGQYVNDGQIEIISHLDWYLNGKHFDPVKVRQGWLDKLQQALARGFAGMRFIANIAWLEKQDWSRFAEYEGTLDEVFRQSPMIGICAYSLERCLAVGVLDVVHHHQFTLARRNGFWESLEGAELKRAREEVQKLNADLERLVWERTAELAAANEELRKEIFERKRTEEALRESREQLQVALQAALIGTGEWDIQTDQSFVSNGLEQMFGFAPGTFHPSFEEFVERVHPEDRELFRTKMEGALAGTSDFALDYRIVWPDGSVHWIASQAQIFFDDTGKPTRLVGAAMDITDRKQVEEALRMSEQKLGEAQRLAHVGYWERDFDSGIIIWSDEAYRIFGVSPEAEPVLTVARLRELIHPDDREKVFETVTQALQGGPRYNIEYRVVRPEGEVRIVHSQGDVILDDSGKPHRLFGAIQDITERKRAQDELKKYELIFSHTPDGISLVDQDYRYQSVNAAYERVSGVKREQLIGLTVAEYLGKQIFDEYIKPSFDRCLRGEIINYQEWFHLPTLGKRFVDVTYFPFIDARDQIAGVVAMSRDITERKQSEEALEMSEARLQAAIDAASIGLWDWDLNSGKITGLGQHDKMFGFAPGEFDGAYSSFEKRVHPEDIEELNKAVRRARDQKSEYVHEYRIVWPDGSIHWIAGRGRFVYNENNQPVQMYGAVLDITERKQAEEAAKESEEQLRLAFEAAKFGTGEMDLETHQITCSDAMQQVLGFAPGTFNPTFPEYVERVHPEDRDIVRQAVENGIAGQPDISVDYRIVWPDGSIHWVASRAKVFYDAAGKATRIIGALMDITEIKQVEEALRLSEQKSAEAQRVAHVGYWERDLDSEIITWSDELYRIFGISPEEEPVLRVSQVREFIHPDDQEKALQIAKQMPQDSPPYKTEYRVVRPDGEVRIVQVHVIEFWDDLKNRLRLFGVVQDITERKRAEEALRQSEFYLAEAQRISHTGSWAWDVAKQEFIHYSDEHYRMYGLDPANGIPSWETAQQFIHPEDRAEVLAKIETAIRDRTDSILDYRAVLPDGSIKSIRSIGHPVFNESGELVEYVGTEIDVTERRRAEELIRQQSARSQLLADISRTLAEAGLNYQSVLDTVAKRTAELVGDLCVIISYFQDGKQNTPNVSYHVNPRALELIQKAFQQDWHGNSQRIGKLMDNEVIYLPVVNPVEFRPTLDPLFWPYFDEIGISSLIYVPLQVHGQVMGAIGVMRDRSSRPFTPEDKAYLREIADRAALTMQNARLFEQIQASQERLQVLSQRLVDVQESEQQRLAREIHDDISQALAMLVLQLGTARNLLPKSAQNVEAILARSEELTEETLEHTRSIIAGLRPQVLDDFGLVPALRYLGDELNSSTGATVKVKTSRLPKRLRPLIEITLYRIVQEALVNIRKHAEARSVTISLVKETERVILSVQDDGVGFEMPSHRARMPGDMLINGGLVIPAGHFGLIGIQEQVAALGGTFQMKSAPGEGTLVQVELPL